MLFLLASDIHNKLIINRFSSSLTTKLKQSKINLQFLYDRRHLSAKSLKKSQKQKIIAPTQGISNNSSKLLTCLIHLPRYKDPYNTLQSVLVKCF